MVHALNTFQLLASAVEKFHQTPETQFGSCYRNHVVEIAIDFPWHGVLMQ
jgi:hypothetical protein